MQKYPDSIIRIVSVEDVDINPLGYYLLKYKNIEELEKKSFEESEEKQTLDSIERRLASMKWEVVNPFSVYGVIRRNENAFVSLTSKYRLQMALK